MRFAVLLAAMAALWVQPAQAVAIWTFNVSVFATGTNTPYTPGQPPQIIPIAQQLSFSVDLPAFAGMSDLGMRSPCNPISGCDPTGLGQNNPQITGAIGYLGGELVGTNFRYISASSTPGGSNYFLAAPTFGVTFLRSSDGSAPVAPIPEPATWALMLIGFGAIGRAMRARPKRSANALALG
jgi:hypothetical protein